MMSVIDVISGCLNVTADVNIRITDSTNVEILYGYIKDIPPCLLNEEVRYFNIRSFRGVDRDENLMEITLENAFNDIFDEEN